MRGSRNTLFAKQITGSEFISNGVVAVATAWTETLVNAPFGFSVGD